VTTLLQCFSFDDHDGSSKSSSTSPQQQSRTVVVLLPDVNQHRAVQLSSSKLSPQEIAHVALFAAFGLGDVSNTQPAFVLDSDGGQNEEQQHKRGQFFLQAVQTAIKQLASVIGGGLFRPQKVFPAVLLLWRHFSFSFALQREILSRGRIGALPPLAAAGGVGEDREANDDDEESNSKDVAASFCATLRPLKAAAGVGLFMSAQPALVTKESAAEKQTSKPAAKTKPVSAVASPGEALSTVSRFTIEVGSDDDNDALLLSEFLLATPAATEQQ
jgi:hypothetical protein